MNCYVMNKKVSATFKKMVVSQWEILVGVYSTPQLADKAISVIKKRAKELDTTRDVVSIRKGVRIFNMDNFIVEYYIKEMPMDNLDIKP